MKTLKAFVWMASFFGLWVLGFYSMYLWVMPGRIVEEARISQPPRTERIWNGNGTIFPTREMKKENGRNRIRVPFENFKALVEETPEMFRKGSLRWTVESSPPWGVWIKYEGTIIGSAKEPVSFQAGQYHQFSDDPHEAEIASNDSVEWRYAAQVPQILRDGLTIAGFIMSFCFAALIVTGVKDIYKWSTDLLTHRWRIIREQRECTKMVSE